MPAKVGGICYFRANGKTLALEGKFDVSVTDVEREVKKGLSGTAVLVEKPVAPYIEATVFVTTETSVEEIHGWTNVRCQAELNNGRTYVLTGAASVTPPVINGAEGTADLKFVGETGKEL